MFLITVILFLICIEITFSCSNSLITWIRQAHGGSVVQMDYKLVPFQLPGGPAARRPGSYFVEIVQLQSAFKDRVATVFQEKPKTYHISEPIIIRFFSKTCASSFTSEQFLSLSFAKKRCNTTLQGFGAFFVQSRDRFLDPFYLLSHFFLSFLIL